MADTELSWGGIQLIWVVLGILGAAFGIGAMPPMSGKQCWTALGSGVVFAGYGPQWCGFAYIHWMPDWVNPQHLPMPGFMLGSIAFICGVGGLFLIPGIIAFWRDPRQFVADVWTYLTVARGKGGSP